MTRCRRVQVVDRLTHSRSRGFGFITFDAIEVQVRGGAQAATPCCGFQRASVFSPGADEVCRTCDALTMVGRWPKQLQTRGCSRSGRGWWKSRERKISTQRTGSRTARRRRTRRAGAGSSRSSMGARTASMLVAASHRKVLFLLAAPLRRRPTEEPQLGIGQA